MLKFLDTIQHVHNSVPHKHMRIECHLIVAAARRMKTAARLPNRIREALFNIHVDVFEFDTERKISALDLREDVTQPLFDGRTILL